MSASCRVILAQESVGGGTSPELPDIEEAGSGELLAMAGGGADSRSYWVAVAAKAENKRQKQRKVESSGVDLHEAWSF